MAKLRISDVKKSTALEARMQRIEPRRRTTGMSKPRQRGEGWIFAEAVRRYREDHPTAQPPSLAGYLCEQCQDASAVRWQAVPEGDERRVCEDCASPEHARGTDGDG